MLQVDAANEDNDKDRMRARIKAVLDYEILEVKNNQRARNTLHLWQSVVGCAAVDPAAPTKTMVTEAGRSRRRAYRTKKEEGARKKLKYVFGGAPSLRYFF